MTPAATLEPPPAPPSTRSARTPPPPSQRRSDEPDGASTTTLAPVPAPTVTGDRLSSAERERLRALEASVRADLGAFVRCGRALAALATEGLYRETHSTFKSYVNETFGMSEARAHQLRQTSETHTILEQAGAEIPAATSEAVLRQLAPTRRERGTDGLIDAWRIVLDRYGDRIPTAPDVRGVLSEAGYPIYGTAPGRNRPRLDQLEQILAQARARVAKIAGHEQRLDQQELEHLADVARALADQLDRLAQADGELLDDPCVNHGAERDTTGTCRACRRPDIKYVS